MISCVCPGTAEAELQDRNLPALREVLEEKRQIVVKCRQLGATVPEIHHRATVVALLCDYALFSMEAQVLQVKAEALA